MNTKILEYIVAIADMGSLSQAAEKFYLSHAALSQHIKNIEADLGTPLFVRTRDGMRPTHAGILYISDARAILHEEAELQKALAQLRQRRKKRIRVMVDSSHYNLLLGKALPAFRALRPEYTVELTNCNASQALYALRSGGAELAFFPSLQDHLDGLNVQSLRRNGVYWVFPKGYTGPKNAAGIAQAIESGVVPVLHPIGTTLRTIEEVRFAQEGVFPSVVMESGFSGGLSLATDRNCCATLPDAFCRQNADAVEVGDLFYEIYALAAAPALAAPSPARQDLIDCFADVLRKL